MTTNRKIAVIGHMNPDTDSICSSIAYSYLKGQVSDKQYQPSRAGAVNPETQFVLDYFKKEAPVYVDDVRQRISDIEIRDLECLTEDVSMKRAWECMNENKVVTLAVKNEADKMIGLLNLSDITRSYMEVYDAEIIGKAKTPYKNILDTITGTMVVGDAEEIVTGGKTLIAAANPDVMESYIEAGDIVLLGNRYESQLCAIEMGAACLIVTNGANTSMTIKKLAGEHNCKIIETGYDTYTAARLMNQSIPVGYFMNRGKIISFELSDFLDDVKIVMAQKRHRYFPILDENGDYVGMISRRNLLSATKNELILVDHNEKSQAVAGLKDATILEIIDHHRIADIETNGPVYFRNQPVGCTSTIVYQMFLENDVEIPADIAGLMLSAILSDTLAFRSPTCTPLDEKTAKKLAEIAGIADIEAYASDMFRAGSELEKRTAEEIFTMDFKKFKAGDYLFGVGQISCMGRSGIEDAKPKLVEAVEEFRKNQGTDMIFLMMTDILTSSSEVLYCGKESGKVISLAFGLEEKATDDILGTVNLEGVISRKKQMIPAMMEAFKAL